MIEVVNKCKAFTRRVRGFTQKIWFVLLYGKRVKIGSSLISDGKIYLTIFQNGRLKIGDKLILRRNFELRCTGSITIGNNCFFNNNCGITAMQSVSIGDECIFGENVLIYDHNHRFNIKNEAIKNQGFTMASVEIGNNVWMGSNVTILKGVKIGNNCVVGANCVVDQDVPDNCIVRKSGQYDFHKLVYKE